MPTRVQPKNPFANSSAKLSAYDVFKIIVLFPLSIIKFFICIFSLSVAIVVVNLHHKLKDGNAKSTKNNTASSSLKPRSSNSPTPFWVSFMLKVCVRLFLHGLSYHYINVSGAPVDPDARIIVSNHCGLADGFIISYLFFPGYVSKAENFGLPLLGTVLRACDCIAVDRLDPNSRHATVEAIKKRAASSPSSGPPLAIFPEGTVTNTSALITFKAGAFIPGVPVQPVALKYRWRFLDPAYTAASYMRLPGGEFTYIWRHFASFINCVDVVVLPTYYPSAEERADSDLYARNVRSLMAKTLNVPVTEHTYDDVVLNLDACKAHLPFNAGLLEMGSLKSDPTMRSVDLDLATSRKMLKRFAELDTDKSGTVNVDEFTIALGLPPTAKYLAEHLFKLLDKDECGEIDFREFVIGIANLQVARARRHGATNNAKESLASLTSDGDVGVLRRLLFESFDVDGSGGITLNEFIKSDAHSSKLKELFALIDSNGDGEISYEEFVKFSRDQPDSLNKFIHLVDESLKAQVQKSFSLDVQQEPVIRTAPTVANNNNNSHKSSKQVSNSKPIVQESPTKIKKEEPSKQDGKKKKK